MERRQNEKLDTKMPENSEKKHERMTGPFSRLIRSEVKVNIHDEKLKQQADYLLEVNLSAERLV